jgi:hypothetical protein
MTARERRAATTADHDTSDYERRAVRFTESVDAPARGYAGDERTETGGYRPVRTRRLGGSIASATDRAEPKSGVEGETAGVVDGTPILPAAGVLVKPPPQRRLRGVTGSLSLLGRPLQPQGEPVLHTTVSERHGP